MSRTTMFGRVLQLSLYVAYLLQASMSYRSDFVSGHNKLFTESGLVMNESASNLVETQV